MSNNNGKKENTTHPHTRNSKIFWSSAKTTSCPPQQPLDRYPPLPFARVKGVDDIGGSNDNNQHMIAPRGRGIMSNNNGKKEKKTATPKQGISEIAQLRNELRSMQSECNRLIKEHDIAIKDLIKEHKTAIATLTRKHEAAIKGYKRMAETNTNLITSIDETCPISFRRSCSYNTPRQHSDPPVKTSGEKIPPVESFESSWINHQQHVHRLQQMIMEEEAKVYDEKQIVGYVDAEKKRTNHDVMSLPSSTTSFEELAVRDADFGTTKVHDRRLATSTGVAKNCFIVPPLHSEIRAMKPKYLANHHHGMKSTESIISGLTMPTSLLHAARTTRPPASIYAEKTFESNLLKLCGQTNEEAD